MKKNGEEASQNETSFVTAALFSGYFRVNNKGRLVADSAQEAFSALKSLTFSFS